MVGYCTDNGPNLKMATNNEEGNLNNISAITNATISGRP